MSTQSMNLIPFNTPNSTTLSLKGNMFPSGITVLIVVALSYPSASKYLSSNPLKNELARIYDLIDELKLSSGSGDLESLPSKLPHLPSIDGRISRTRRDVADTAVLVADKLIDMVTVSTKDLIDVSFTTVEGEDKYNNYVAVLNTTHVSLHTIAKNESASLIKYPLSNGKSLTAIGFSNCMLLAAQTVDEGTVILKYLPSKRVLVRAHTLPFFDVVHTVMWECENFGILLGVATESTVFIFKWLGEHFNQIHVFNIDGQKIVPFRHETFPFLAIAGSKTIVSEYSLSKGKFLIAQALPKSHDVASFSAKIRNFEEKYVCVCHVTMTIVYKEAFNRYTPFQQLPASKSCIPSIQNESILLALLIEHEVKIYQYDGWRFVDIDRKIPDVGHVRETNVFGGKLLIGNVRGDTWKIISFAWRKIDSWETLMARTRNWCSDTMVKAERTFNSFDEFSGTLTISNAYVDKIKIKNMNDERTVSLMNLSKKYQNVLDSLAQQKSNLATKKVSGDWKLTSLRAKKVSLHSSSKWKVERIVSDDEKFANLSKLRRVDDSHRSLQLKNVRLTHPSMTKCPLPSFLLTRTIVLNDTEFRNLQKDSLKIVGDQEVFGIHVYEKLNVTKGVFPIEISHGLIKSKLLLPEVRTTSLNINGGGILLPLNGSSQVISGSIKGSKVTLNGTVDLHAKCTGDAFKDLLPVVVVPGTLELKDNYQLQNVQIQNFFKAGDISREGALPLSQILENAVPLKENLNQHVTLKNVSWTAVNLTNVPNFVRPSSEIVATKKFPQKVTLASTENLPIPKIDIPFCARTAIGHSLKKSSLTIGKVYAENLDSVHVIENGTLNKTIFSLVSSLQEANISRKLFDRVIIKNLTVLQPGKLNLSALKNLSDSWIQENRFKGPITVKNFKTRSLEGTVRFKCPLPKAIKSMRCEGNIRTRRINNINFDSFASRVVYKNDTSMRNITFLGGFTCEKMRAAESSITFPRFVQNLGSKRILSTLSTTSLTLPYDFSYDSPDKPKRFLLTGTAHFEEEPAFGIINDRNVNDLIESIWMKNNSAFLTGGGIKMQNMTFKSEIISEERIFDEWIKFAPLNLLSRTKPQTINVPANLNSARMKNVVGGEKSRLKLSAAKYNDLLWDTLTDEGPQVINSTWRFDKLYASDKLRLEGRVNGLNLTTDVVRYDSDTNIVTGKKIMQQLSTKTLHYAPFSDWAQNAITVQDTDLIIVKGMKVFRSVDINKLTVSGTISGRTVDKMLRKSGDQEIQGFKTIEGFVNASSFLIDSFINDVNVTSLVESQLKKNSSVQRISGNIVLKDGLDVMGNIRTKSSYQGVQLRNIDNGTEKLESITKKMSEVMEIVDAIDAAIQNHAFFLRKLEAIPNATLIEDNRQQNISVESSLHEAMGSLNNSLSTELISFDDNKFRILIDGNWVYCSDEESCPEEITALNVPDMIGMSAKRTRNSLWIVVKLSSKMLVLRYDLWGQLKSYELPYANDFRLEAAPNDELLMIRPDGIWKLGGLGNPKHIIKFPSDEFVSILSSDGRNIRMKSADSETLLKTRYTGD